MVNVSFVIPALFIIESKFPSSFSVASLINSYIVSCFNISNCKILANCSPSKLISNPIAKSAYFGDSFKIN